jgi:pimeloyl-ACP methyl ester carboxylesterase
VYIGHSYDSYLGNHLAAIYPNDADDLVLTGWSAQMPVLKGNPTLEAKAILLAAELSKAFAGLEAGYLAQINGTAVEMAYYSGGYDPILPRLDFAVEDTIGISQLCSVTEMRTTSHF